MIYRSHPKEMIYINKNDYVNRGHAYEAACINAEIENMCSSGDWYDEKTNQLLFTEVCRFEPDSGYYDNGQGQFVSTYTAHFKLKDGQTAEEAFNEMRQIDIQQMLYQQECQMRAEQIQTLPTHIQDRLKNTIDEIQKQSDAELKLKIKQAEENAISEGKKWMQARNEMRQSSKKRQQDPIWHATCKAAISLVTSNQKEAARILVKGYLDRQKI